MDRKSKDLKSISEFTSKYYVDEFYGDKDPLEDTTTQLPTRKHIFEFNFFVFTKYLVYETILAGIFYLIYRFRYVNALAFALFWLLFLNGVVWIIVIAIFGLMILESASLRKIQKSGVYQYEKRRLDKYF